MALNKAGDAIETVTITPAWTRGLAAHPFGQYSLRSKRKLSLTIHQQLEPLLSWSGIELAPGQSVGSSCSAMDGIVLVHMCFIEGAVVC